MKETILANGPRFMTNIDTKNCFRNNVSVSLPLSDKHCQFRLTRSFNYICTIARANRLLLCSAHKACSHAHGRFSTFYGIALMTDSRAKIAHKMSAKIARMNWPYRLLSHSIAHAWYIILKC